MKTLPLLALLAGCSVFLPSAPDDRDLLDGPIEGLEPRQEAEFARGDELFAKVFSVETGLGPVFVQTACAGCHAGDGKAHPGNALFRTANAKYGPQVQHRAIPGYTPEPIPTVHSRRVAPAVTGLGFLQAVPDSSIISIARAQALDVSDSVTGEVSRITPNPFFVPDPMNDATHHQPDTLGRYVGRFGYKATSITLLDQTVGAYVQDMGVSSEYHPEDIYNVDVGKFTGGGPADPEISAADVNSVVFYLRTLKTPPRRNPDDAKVKAGEALFSQIGCAACHVPTLKTGDSEVAALRNQMIHPYTDLLLHDMGASLNDGVPEGSAQPYEWRTTPLWGLGLAEGAQGGKAYYLHDGSAETIEGALLKHGGEAQNARDAFSTLSGGDQGNLIEFLKSL